MNVTMSTNINCEDLFQRERLRVPGDRAEVGQHLDAEDGETFPESGRGLQHAPLLRRQHPDDHHHQ